MNNYPIYNPKHLAEFRWEVCKAFVWTVFMLLVLLSFVFATWMTIFQKLSLLVPIFWGLLFLAGAISKVSQKTEQKTKMVIKDTTAEK